MTFLSSLQNFFELEGEKAALQDAANVKMGVLSKKMREKEEVIRSLRNELELYEEFGFKKVVSFIYFHNKLIIININPSKQDHRAIALG